MEVKRSQYPNAPEIEVTEFGIVIDVKRIQPQKVPLSIDLTELGIVKEVKLAQPLKAEEPIVFTELGISIEIKLEQSEKALLPIEVTELGNWIVIKPLPSKVLSLIEVMELGIIIEFKAWQ